MFFYIQIPISEYRETHGRKKIETHPNTRRKPAFSASIAAFRALRAFRACTRAYYELFFLEESSVNPRCARGPSLSRILFTFGAVTAVTVYCSDLVKFRNSTCSLRP